MENSLLPPDRDGPVRWPRVGVFLLLAGTVLAGYCLRARDLHRSLWLDELTTAWVISDGPGEIPPRAWLNNLSPLPYYITWASCWIFGHNELGLRLPCLAAGLAGIVLAAFVVFRLSGSWSAGLVGAALVAVDRDMVRYAVETRPYAIIQFAALLQAYCFFRATQRPSLALRLAWAGLSVLLFYLHYTTALLLAAEGVYYVLIFIRDRARPAYKLLPALVDAGLVALACLPGAAHVLYLKAHQSVLSSWMPGPSYPMECLSFFAFDKNVFFPGLVACAAAFALRPAAPPAETPQPPAQDASGDWPMLVFVGCWFLVPICLAWAAAYAHVIMVFVGRYLIVSSLATVVLGGLVLVRFRSAWARGAFVAVALAMHVGFSVLSGPPELDQQNWRDATAFARGQARGPDGLVLVHSGLVEEGFLKTDSSPALREYLCSPVYGPYWPKDDRVVRYPFAKDQSPLDEHLLALLRDHNQACLLALHDVQKSLDQALTACAGRDIPVRLVDKKQFGSVFVYLLRRGISTTTKVHLSECSIVNQTTRCHVYAAD